MLQRNFNEIDLRTLLFSAQNYEADIEEGRFKIKSGLKGNRWEIIVEPDYFDKLLVVITAYPIEN
jgi:hypothetical protein